jgi:hypothetical protein
VLQFAEDRLNNTAECCIVASIQHSPKNSSPSYTKPLRGAPSRTSAPPLV